MEAQIVRAVAPKITVAAARADAPANKVSSVVPLVALTLVKLLSYPAAWRE